MTWKAALRAVLKDRGRFYLIGSIITSVAVAAYGALSYDPGRAFLWGVQGGLIMFTSLVAGATMTHRKEARATEEAARVSD